jgi:hypothetical protein
MIDQKHIENEKYFNYQDSVLTNDAIYTREIKSRTVMSQAAFSKKFLFTRRLDLNLRTKPTKRYNFSIALCDFESWILRKLDQNYLESFKM